MGVSQTRHGGGDARDMQGPLQDYVGIVLRDLQLFAASIGFQECWGLCVWSFDTTSKSAKLESQSLTSRQIFVKSTP